MTIEFAGAPLDIPVSWSCANTTVGIGGTVFAGPSFAGLGVAEVGVQATLVRKCRIVELIVVTSTAQGAGGSLVLTLRINGAPTTEVITIPLGTAAGTFRDASSIIAAAQGDLVSVQLVNNDGAAVSAAVVSIGFVLRSSPV